MAVLTVKDLDITEADIEALGFTPGQLIEGIREALLYRVQEDKSLNNRKTLIAIINAARCSLMEDHLAAQPTRDIDKCEVGNHKLNISAGGEVFPCEAFKWLGNQGIRPSIYEFSLDYIWKHDPLLKLLREEPLPEPCRSLSQIVSHCQLCQGGCKGQYYLNVKHDWLKNYLRCQNPKVYNLAVRKGG